MMTVLMTMRLQGDPKRVEQVAAGQSESMQTILDTAEKHGLISHRFWGTNDEILVVDEWPSKENFESFFVAERERIDKFMSDAGVTSEPEITYWQRLETGDEFG